MEGMEVIVELKTGKRLRGTMSSADDNMNLTLEQTINQPDSLVIEKDRNLLATLETSIHIRGSNIRCIQFPDNADLRASVSSGMELERTAANKYKRGKRN